MFNRGGFPGQRPMGHGPMNQASMNHPGMNMSGMNMSGMNMSGMGMAPMNQPSMNLSGMNHPGMNHQRIGPPGMNLPNIGLSGMNQPMMNQPIMNQPSMNQPIMNQPSMNQPIMNQPSMNQPIMNQPNMNQPNMNQPSMNQPNMNQSSMNQSSMNQSSMNLNRMNHPGMNQGGGMGFLPEMKSQAFGMRSMDNTGSFGGNTDPMGMKAMPVRSPMHQSSDRLMGSQVLPQRFASPNLPMHQGQPRMPAQNQEIPSIVNRVLTHSSDRMMVKPKAPLQEPAHLMKEKQWDNLNVNLFGNVSQEMGMKPVSSGAPMNQGSSAQNRYTNESASSILESFGLSNEDLEELSRYPDDQLTPANMPSILRDIRLRKINRPTSAPDQPAGRRPGGEAIQSKVIDYGHSSKYQYKDTAAPARSYDPPRTEPKLPPGPKETPPPNIKKHEKSPQKGMDNKIPTISGSRKPSWPSSKPDRSNNKTLVGEDPKAPADVSVTVHRELEKPAISHQADAAAVPDVAAEAEMKSPVPVVTGVGKGTYQKAAEPPAAKKGSWVPVLSQEEAQKMKKLPTPSMMNDYYAASPRIFPHICSLCNLECRHLKDWIKHQNNLSHIEFCRNLRQQYPDWNPQVLSSVSKKDEATSKQSKSKSTSPRRSRRSGSRHRARKSRSRSPRSSGRRSRSRSPRRPRYSPDKSRSPRHGPRSPHRSRSPRRYRRSSHSNSPDKKAVDLAVQDFIESSKQKSCEKTKPAAKPANNGKKQPPPKPTNSNVKNKKPGSSAPPQKKPGSTSSSSSSSKKPSSNNSSSSAARKPTSTAKKPPSGGSSYKKPVVSTGAKKTGAKPPPSRQSAANQKTPGSPSAASKEGFNKFTSKNNSWRIIHVTNLPDSGYTDQDILKIAQPFGKVCDVLIVRSKNEAFIETNFREAAAAAVKFSEETAVMINNQRVTLSLAGQSKKPVKSAEKGGKTKEEPPKAPAQSDKSATKAPVKKGKAAPEKEAADKKAEEKSGPDLEIPPGFVKCYKLSDPPLRENEKCVILIGNLPEGQYTVDEIANLAKPFGGVNDILIVANHRKAYLELTSKNSVDSLIKFYNVFPTYLSGNLLSISVAQRYKDLKDEDLIFADLIEQASYKITPTIYEKFVYLTNLPDKDVEEFEILRIGLRFGKVEHYVLLSNKKKAILHLHSESAAKAMHIFLSQYPCNIGENILQCALPSKTQLAKEEYIMYVEVEKQSTDSDAEKTESAAAKSEESDNKEEKPKDEEAKDKDAETPDPQSEMEVDPAEDKGAAEEEGTTSGFMVVATEDDDDDEEEAAEAPEAPDTLPLYVPAEPEAQRHYSHPVSHPQMSEELDVLVSVESDEEEAEEQQHFLLGTKRCPPPLPVSETSMDEGTSDGPESDAIQDGQKVRYGDRGPSKMEVTTEISPAKEQGSKPKAASAGDGRSRPNEESSKRTKDEAEVPEAGAGAGTAGVSMVRTTKYNPQKGEISVTVTLDSQKSNSKTTDSKKRTSRERGTSGHESSSTPRSNRSSPADSASGHTKAGANFSQKKGSGKYFPSQPERDSKDPSRSRERDPRSSSKKDDRSRGSSSSRYARSSKTTNRSPRSKEEEETFPFNLDEFVTVDEIVEEHVDPKNKAAAPEEKADPARKGKRKENDPPPAAETKKSRVTSTDSQQLSFVTLDEVGDEEDSAGAQGNQAERAAPSLVTLDEVHTEDGPPATAKEELMTLDEISDDDDTQDSTTGGQRATTTPEILAKDQLLTLDEVNEEDEEHTTPAKTSDIAETKLPEDQKEAEVKKKKKEEEGDGNKGPEAEVQKEVPAKEDRGEHSEQPLLTLDEVKADDDEVSFADIEHQFLTVDEIGEEEDESETKAAGKEPKAEGGSNLSEAKDPADVTPAKRGRPQKRPLQSVEGSEDSSPAAPDTSKGAAPQKAPAAKPSKGSEQGPAGSAQDGTAAPSDKTGLADKKTETPAKKTKVESPPAEKSKLAPFNPSTPVGLEYLVPKTGYFCELCSLFYMDDSSKLKHCRSLRHYQAVEKHLAKSEESSAGKTPST